MALPFPNLPAGAVRIVFQVNVEGSTPTAKVLAPRIVVKLRAFMPQFRHQENGAWVTGFSNLAEMFAWLMREYLVRPAEGLIPDAPDPAIESLKAQLEATQLAAKPVFLE